MQSGAEPDNDALAPDFRDFIECLNAARVDCVLVGGYALAIYGVIRATGGIDFLIRRTRRNVDRLCRSLEHFGAPESVIDANALMEPGTVMRFGSEPFRIDLLNTIDGVTFGQVWKGSHEISVDGQRLRVIGLDELRANKLATGRRKDADDARKLSRGDNEGNERS